MISEKITKNMKTLLSIKILKKGDLDARILFWVAS